jgi:hypothetical protein
MSGCQRGCLSDVMPRWLVWCRLSALVQAQSQLATGGSSASQGLTYKASLPPASRQVVLVTWLYLLIHLVHVDTGPNGWTTWVQFTHVSAGFASDHGQHEFWLEVIS